MGSDIAWVAVPMARVESCGTAVHLHVSTSPTLLAWLLTPRRANEQRPPRSADADASCEDADGDSGTRSLNAVSQRLAVPGWIPGRGSRCRSRRAYGSMIMHMNGAQVLGSAGSGLRYACYA